MALALSGSLALTEPSIAPAARLPRICYRNHFLDGTVTASSEQIDNPATMATDAFTDTAWIGDAAGTSWWIRVSKVGASADYAALMAWDLTGVTVTVQYSDNAGVDWSNITDPVMAVDRVVVFLFDQAMHDDWRLLFEGAAPPEVASVSIGLATVMDTDVSTGFEPPRQARNNTISNNATDQGHLVGRSIVRRGINTQLAFGGVREQWVRDTWEPFVDHAETRPFYLVWSPVRWPSEAAFVWTKGAIRPPRYANSRYMDVSLDVQGFAR